MQALLNWIDSVEGVLGHWVIRFRWLIIVGSIVVVCLTGYGLKYAGLSTGYRPLFNEDDEKLAALDALEEEFTKVSNILLLVESKSGNIFTQEGLAIIKELTDTAWSLRYSTRVDSVTNFQHTVAHGDDLLVNDLVEDPDSLTPEAIQMIKQIALAEPSIRGELLSEAGDVAGVNVIFHLPEYVLGEELTEVAVTRTVEEVAREFEARYPNINIYISGRVAVDNAFYQVGLDDIKTLIPLSVLFMMVVLFIMSRSVTGTILTAIVIVASIIVPIGVIAYTGTYFHTGNGNGPTIILTIASASCVHLLMTYLHSLRQQGDNHQAIVEALRINFQPITLTSITTAIGFLSILLSDVPAFRVLSVMVTLGIFSSLFLVILLLPALLSFLPNREMSSVDERADKMASATMEKLGKFVAYNRQWLLIVMLVFVAITMLGIPKNQLDDNFITYFDETTSFRQAADFSVDKLTGVYAIQFELDSQQPGGINTIAFLQDAEGFTEWLKQQPEVLHVLSVVDTYKRLNKSMHGDQQDYYRLPETREEAAQYLLLYELSLPYGLDLNNQMNFDKSKIRLIVKMSGLSSTQFVEFNDRAVQWAKNNAPNMRVPSGESPTLLFSEKSLANGKNMILTTSVALIAISFLLILMLRSFKIGMISIIPNLIPAAIGFGIWGFIDGQITIILSLVMTMTLGIVVDDTVHFLSKYQRARRELNKNAEEAVIYSFKTVGQALIVTSIMLASGFFILMQSHFELNSEMGLLTGIIVLAALVADFFLLPPLLMKLDRK